MEKNVQRFATGMILGKFMPLHKGHQHLIEFARPQVEHLTVIVGSLAAEPIPGHLRFDWVRELYPELAVYHCTDENPQYPHEHPDFWTIWVRSIRRFLPDGPEVVFSSEEYGEELARRLGTVHVSCDLARDAVPISATRIRENPYANWHFIPELVRPYYTKRVVVYGPESTGKTTLAARLAEHYQTVWVPEYARAYLDAKGAWVEYGDIPIIARGQIQTEEALARQANRLLVCDTDLLTTCVYSLHYFRECPQDVMRKANQREYDLYLLLDIDVPWVEDWQRPDPGSREFFFDWFKRELDERDRNYIVVSGSYEERFETAKGAVDTLFERETGERKE
jgi:HTH-type transcriptional regulator, transcriptional repressor of NAD biosynthesis genes